MDIDLRVTDAGRWRSVGTRAVVFLPLAILGGWAASSDNLPNPAIGVGIVVLGALIAVYAIGLTVVRLQVTEGVVVVGRLFGRTRTFPPGTLGHAVLLDAYEQLGAPIAPKLALFAPDRSRVLTVSGHLVDDLDLGRFFRALPCEQVHVDETLTPAMLEQRFPGVAPWWELHPWGVAWIVTGVTVVVGIVVGLVNEGALL